MIKTINRYNLNNLASEYQAYLNSLQTLSKVSKKNYFSDINHFILWLSQSKIQSPSISERPIREDDLAGYIEYLQSNNLPVSSFNRKLSSLRNFMKFCFNRGFIKTQFSLTLKNITVKDALLKEYLAEVKTDDKNTTHNDISEFITSIDNS